jgi:hypothetical protein
VLSLIPPMTQLNTPYPSTAYLTGFLRSRGVDARQDDLALRLVLELFSPAGLDALRDSCAPCRQEALGHAGPVRRRVRPLPGHRHPDARLPAGPRPDPRPPHRQPHAAARGPRFASLDVYYDPDGGDPLAWAFGALGVQDKARHLATLYLNDLADVLREAADPRFEFVRYAESLAMAQPSFEPLARALAAPPTLVDETLRRLTLDTLARHQPQVVLLSVPFPGSVYAAFRIAQTIKAHDPSIVTVLGGGFVNTELRELTEPRVFDYFDYVTLDDGERPLLALLEHLAGKRGVAPGAHLPARGGAVRYINLAEPDIPFAEVGTPTWDGLPLTATCRCSTCSTRCTGCGPTGAGTSSPWPTAATGRSAASAT